MLICFDKRNLHRWIYSEIDKDCLRVEHMARVLYIESVRYAMVVTFKVVQTFLLDSHILNFTVYKNARNGFLLNVNSVVGIYDNLSQVMYAYCTTALLS